MDMWTQIEAGREAFADYLDGLSPDDWNKQSLCADWTVKEVAAHMLVIPTMSKGQVFTSFLRSGFNLNKMNAALVRSITSRLSGADIAQATRSSAGSRSMPPGLKLPGLLTELAVHSADVADGVGSEFALAPTDYTMVLDHLKLTQPVFGSKQRIAGLTLRAVDSEWETGSGPTVEGTARNLVMAVAGRPSAYERLSGDGVSAMRSR